jgi:hypothetical protein
MGRGKLHTGFWWGNLEEKRPLGRSRRQWEDNIIWILKKWDGEARAGLIWLGIGTGGGHL